jgi:uncharacterized protein
MNAVMLPVSLMLAGGLALIALWLAARVGQVRTAEKVSIGDGGSDRLIRRMRAHANFAENAPLLLVLFALVEFAAGTSTWLWVAAALLLVARVLHAIGMDGWVRGRTIGTAITFALLLGLGGYALALPFLSPATHAVPAPLPAG